MKKKPHDGVASTKLTRAVLDGRLTLAQAGQISSEELKSVAAYAEDFRRKGELSLATEAYQLLVLFDPYEPTWWRPLAELHARQGQAAPALGAYQMLEILGAADVASMSRSKLCEEQLMAVQPD